MGQEDYKELFSFLGRFTRRLRVLKGIEGLCLIGICLFLLFSLGLGIQEVKAFFPYAPMAYSLFAVILLTLLTGWTLFQCGRRVPRESAAFYIEKKCPHLRNNIINSLQLYPQVTDENQPRGISASLVLALLRTTRKQLQVLNVNDLIDTQRIRTEVRLLGILFIPVLAVVLFNPSSVSDTFSLLTDPLKGLPPSETRIDVTPKGIRLARGSAVTIHATASGAIPNTLDLILWPEGKEQQQTFREEKVQMEGTGGGRFSATIRDLQRSLRYRVAAGSFTSASYTIEAVDPPKIGNLKVTLYPPYYTGLPKQTLEGGNIEGIKGSTIRLEAMSTKELAKAKILLGKGTTVPLKIEGKNLSGKLVLFEPERYQILAEDPLGFRNNPITYEFRLRPDGFPTIELLKPTEDLEINGDETLPLEFRAKDDFGIQEVSLTFRVGDREEKLPVEKERKKSVILRNRFDWDLEKLGLREGDELIYHLDVLDNDTVSGPKLGSSRVLRLRLKNLRGKHRRIAETIRDLSGRMVDLLGDHLETAPADDKEPLHQEKTGDRNFHQKLEDMLKSVEEVMQRTEKDRLTDFATWSDLEALKRNLQFTKENLLKKQEQASSLQEKTVLHDEISSELERMSMLSEEISKRLKAQEVASTAEDLMKSQERLLDSLDRLKSGDKKLDVVLKEISNLAKLLASLQQSLSQLTSRLPEEFINSDAIRGLGLRDMLSALERIRKKLQAGDIEGAMQLAREFFNQLASMVAALRNAQQSAMSTTMGRVQGEMLRSTSELQQIAREQQEILLETEGTKKKRRGRSKKILKEKIDAFEAKAQEELSHLGELFLDEEEESESGEGQPREQLNEAVIHNLLKNMIAQLLKKNFSGFGEIMEKTQKELGKKHRPEQGAKTARAETGLDSIKADLAALLQKSPVALTEEEKKKLRDLSYREKTLKKRTKDLHEKLKTLFQLFPSLDPKITRNIQAAGRSMGKAQNHLSDLDAEAALPPEREALDRLSQSQQQMQNSMAQLAQRGQLGRLPVTYLFRRGRFLPSGRLIPLPGMAQFPDFDTEGGITGFDTEKFPLPGKDAYKAPRRFREEILESLKQGVPAQMKEQIESYFKNLSD